MPSDLPPDHPGLAPPVVEPSLLVRAWGGTAVLLLFVVAQLFIGVALAAAHVSLALTDITVGRAVAVLVVEIALLVLGAALVPGAGGWRAVGLRRPASDVHRAWRVLAPCGLMVVGPGIALAVSSSDTPVVDPGQSLGTSLVLVVLALAIGVTEELWFRGLVIARLRPDLGAWFAVVASAVLFGAPHAFGGPAAMLNAAGVGLAVGIPFAVVRVRVGALVPLIGWHAVIDTWAFLHSGSVEATGTPDASDIVAGLVLPGLLAAGYALWFARTSGDRTLT